MNIFSIVQIMNNKYSCIIDIETAPLQLDFQIQSYFSERPVSADRIELHPLFAQVISVGLMTPNSSIQVKTSDDETSLLRWFWEQLAKIRPSSSYPLVT